MNYCVVIIEDEETAYLNLRRLLEKRHKNYMILGWLRSVQEAIKWLAENPKPDLIFLDVHLGDGLSFSIFKDVPIDCPIIFTTAYEVHALRAFELDSIDYLLKPFSSAQLEKSIHKFEKRSNSTGINPSVLAKIVEGFQEKQVIYVLS